MSGTTTYTPATFVVAFPEFADGSIYPATSIAFWMNAATGFVDQSGRWGTLYEAGLYLVTAHFLVLAARMAASAAKGALPGSPIGPQGSKSVGGVSVSYDINSIMEKDAGSWNMTVYGIRYIGMARLLGIGGVQIGYGVMPGWPGLAGGWPGPMGQR